MLEHWLLNAPAMIYVKSSRTFLILNKNHEPIIEIRDIEEAILFDAKLSRMASSRYGLAAKNDNFKRHSKNQPVTKLRLLKGKKA